MAQGMFQSMAIPKIFNLLFLRLIDIQMIKIYPENSEIALEMGFFH